MPLKFIWRLCFLEQNSINGFTIKPPHHPQASPLVIVVVVFVYELPLDKHQITSPIPNYNEFTCFCQNSIMHYGKTTLTTSTTTTLSIKCHPLLSMMMTTIITIISTWTWYSGKLFNTQINPINSNTFPVTSPHFLLVFLSFRPIAHTTRHAAPHPHSIHLDSRAFSTPSRLLMTTAQEVSRTYAPTNRPLWKFYSTL